MVALTTVPRIGVLSAGQMGSAIAGVLHHHGGLEVLTALDGRSPETRARAAEVGMRDVGQIATLAREVDVLLAILRPVSAEQAARSTAAALDGSDHSLVYVDCNAIPPAAAVTFEGLIQRAGGRFVDAAIQSPPPKGPGLLLYVSGEHAGELAFLRDHGIDLRVLVGPVGQASALDLVVGGTSKPFEAAAAQIFLAARQWGLEEVLQDRVSRIPAGVEHLGPLMPSRAARWAEEMVETSHFMREIGLPGRLFTGAAETLTLIAGSETVENGASVEWPASQRKVIEIIAADLERSGTIAAPKQG